MSQVGTRKVFILTAGDDYEPKTRLNFGRNLKFRIE